MSELLQIAIVVPAGKWRSTESIEPRQLRFAVVGDDEQLPSGRVLLAHHPAFPVGIGRVRASLEILRLDARWLIPAITAYVIRLATAQPVAPQ